VLQVWLFDSCFSLSKIGEVVIFNWQVVFKRHDVHFVSYVNTTMSPTGCVLFYMLLRHGCNVIMSYVTVIICD